MKIGGSLARSARSTCLVSGLVFLWPRQWGSSKTCRFFCHAVSLFCCIHVSCLEPLVFLCLQSGNGPKAFTLHTSHSCAPLTLFNKTSQPTLHTPHALRPTLHTLSTPLFTLRTPHFYTPRSTLSIPHSTLHTLRPTVHIPHFTLHTLRCTLQLPRSQPPHSTTHPPRCNCREVCARLLKTAQADRCVLYVWAMSSCFHHQNGQAWSIHCSSPLNWPFM